MVCKHAHDLKDFKINGVQYGEVLPPLLLVTCPSCGSTINFQGEVIFTDALESLTEIAKALDEMAPVDLLMCEATVDFVTHDSTNPFDLVFADQLRRRIKLKQEQVA